MAESDIFKISKFNGQDFHLWKFRMRLILEEKGLWGFVNGTETLNDRASDNVRRDFERRERKAYALICLALDDSQLMLVQATNNAAEAWAKLESNFERKGLANRLFLRKKFFSMAMEESKGMLDHINEVKKLASQLEAIGAAVSEEDIVTTLLCSLPESYSNLIIALESRAGDLSLEFVTARLLHEEQKRGQMSELNKEFQEKALVGYNHRERSGCGSSNQTGNKSTDAQKKFSCHRCGEVGHWKRECPSQKSGICNYCGNRGHFARECWKKASDREKQNQANSVEDRKTEDEDEEVYAFMANTKSNDQDWFIDSGASCHMSCHKEWFSSLQLGKHFPKVCLGDDHELDVQGKGKIGIMLQTPDGTTKGKLKEVLYVPGLEKNLFSVSACTKHGMEVEFTATECLIKKRQKVVGYGKKNGKLYKLLCTAIMEKKVIGYEPNVAESKYTAYCISGATKLPTD